MLTIGKKTMLLVGLVIFAEFMIYSYPSLFTSNTKTKRTALKNNAVKKDDRFLHANIDTKQEEYVDDLDNNGKDEPEAGDADGDKNPNDKEDEDAKPADDNKDNEEDENSGPRKPRKGPGADLKNKKLPDQIKAKKSKVAKSDQDEDNQAANDNDNEANKDNDKEKTDEETVKKDKPKRKQKEDGEAVQEENQENEDEENNKKEKGPAANKNILKGKKKSQDASDDAKEK
jgi:hypothetical protein